jgi:hypothetical protein
MRVIAIESLKNGKLRSYSEGEYIGDLIPDIKPFNEIKMMNPCILLDGGKYVWGFQCWWSNNIEWFNETYSEYIKETEIIDIGENEVLPLTD